MPSLAFFDLDRTILSVNSATLWVKRELQQGNITTLQSLRALAWIAAYGVGFARMEDVIQDAVATLKGQKEREVIDRTLAFWQSEVRKTIRPGARTAIAAHKAAGDLIFLLTSSSNYLSAPVCDLLALDGFLANRFVVRGGELTGEIVEPVCFGAGKVQHALAVAAKLNLSVADSTFYTDSASDLPMLLAVKTPVAVNPDPRLRRIARHRGWAIEDWGVPAADAR